MEITGLNKDRKRRKPAIDLSTMVYGKVPPQAKELEEAILGALMLEKSAFDTVSEIIKPECFYVDAHQYIFLAMQSLQQKSTPIDILTVVEELKMQGKLDLVGGPYYVTKLTNSVVSTANIDAHARIVLQKFIQRELIKISGEIIGDAYEEGTDVFDLLDESETKMFNITNNYLKKNFEDIGGVLIEAITRIDELRTKTDEISGVPSGFSSLDRITYGWQPTDLIILAARPSVGKTAFALNLARNAALHPTKPIGVGFFSLEMSAAQLVQRILSAESEIKMEKISRGKLEDHEYQQLHSKGIKKLENAPLYIDDTAALNIFEFRAKARRMVNKHQVGIIIIDYLQLMSGSNDKGGNREQEISSISRNLKSLAKELKVPIIALSQLSRAVETRKESKMPQLSDLRESGAIEQDADMVMFIYRPEYYENNTNEMGEPANGETHIRIAKHRNGSLETIKLRAKLEIQKFEEMDAEPGPGNWKPIQPGSMSQGNGETAFFIQKGSKMNQSSDFDEGFDDGAPFKNSSDKFYGHSFFYEADLPVTPGLFTLSEESSKHCSVVLRMQPGESVALTNGEGMSCTGRIVTADKRRTVVQLSNHKQIERILPQNSIAISFVKNAARMEWFLEKATEIGIAAFYPLIAERTERTHFKKERWEHILISAMLQSKQVFKPVLHDPVEFKAFLQQPFNGHLLMAHCEEGPKQLIQSIDKKEPALLLIGPEGDFSPSEIIMAREAGATMISLGVTRLRTETAGIAAAVLLQHR